MFAPNRFVLKVKLVYDFSDPSVASSIVGTVLVLLCLLALVIFFVIRSKKTTTVPVVKEEDNPDYGTYYYADGDRRVDVMEVNLYLS